MASWPGAVGELAVTPTWHPPRPWKRSRKPGRLRGLHESTFLPATHVTTIDGIPVTTVERTLFDLAAVLKRKKLDRAVANAVNKGQTTIAKLERVFVETARRGRKGSKAMRQLLSDLGDGYVPTESELEDLVIAVRSEEHTSELQSLRHLVCR